MTPTLIEVFADVSCPFAHAGLHRWFSRRDLAGRNDVGLHVRAWPLEIVNGAPLTGDALAPKVAALSKVFPELFRGFDARRFPSTTLPALRLTHRAYAVGIATGERMASQLRDHLFVDGDDISDPDLLADLARHHGVPEQGDAEEDPVLDDLEEGRRRGVIGSPHYFGPGFDAFCPGLDIGHVGDELDVAATGARFDEFLERCFEPRPGVVPPLLGT